MSKKTKIKKSSKVKRLFRPNKADEKATFKNENTIKRVENVVVIALMVFLVILHFIFFLHSGVLWRDEISTVNLINLPLWSALWGNLHFDSFPVLWILLLKAWSAAGLASTDATLRLLGLIIGFGVLSALWYAARSLEMRLPIISLVLFAMSPVVFFGDTLRAYGLGVLLILLSLGAMWRFLRHPTVMRMILCAAIIILSVHSLYHNSFLVFAICVSAAVVGVYRRQRKVILFSLGTGMIAAISLLPYIGIISKVGDYNVIMKFPITLSWICDKLKQTIDPSGILLTWIWITLALFTIIILIWFLVKSMPTRFGEQKDLAVFLLSTMVISVIAYIFFIKILSYPTQSWYYLPLLAILIVIIDKAIDIVCKNNLSRRVIRIVCVLGVAAATFTNSWDAAHIRRTNMDVLATKLETLVGKNDLIVVTRHYYGISFARYYKGSVSWVTLPEIADHSGHRYDLVKNKMMESEPIKHLLQKTISTMQGGNNVWLVGGLDFLRPGEIPRELPPAPNSSYGWSEGAYLSAWSDMVAYTLQTYGQTLTFISIPVDDPVSELENLPLMVVGGWRP
jgi:hypothetical protein